MTSKTEDWDRGFLLRVLVLALDAIEADCVFLEKYEAAVLHLYADWALEQAWDAAVRCMQVGEDIPKEWRDDSV